MRRIKLATKGHASQPNKQIKGGGGGGGVLCTCEHILAIRHFANKCAKHAKTCEMHCEIETALRCPNSPPLPPPTPPTPSPNPVLIVKSILCANVVSAEQLARVNQVKNRSNQNT